MRTPTPKDFEIIESWGLEKNPFAAIDDYSELKRELRWMNSEHRVRHDAYLAQRLEWIEYKKNFDHYYRTARKPVSRLNWEYLMKRKAWYIMPLGWENISQKSCRVVDIGCGDGDTIQRLVHFIEKSWAKDKICDRKIQITGIDLNESRIENAKKLVTITHPNISVEFMWGDLTSFAFDIPSRQFDYALCTGVIEVIDDGKPLETFLDHLCRITKRGFYSEELVDKYPGGNPRFDLPQMLSKKGFTVKKYHLILTEPFSLFQVSDPLKLWPVHLDQNLYAEAESERNL